MLSQSMINKSKQPLTKPRLVITRSKKLWPKWIWTLLRQDSLRSQPKSLNRVRLKKHWKKKLNSMLSSLLNMRNSITSTNPKMLPVNRLEISKTNWRRPLIQQPNRSWMLKSRRNNKLSRILMQLPRNLLNLLLLFKVMPRESRTKLKLRRKLKRMLSNWKPSKINWKMLRVKSLISNNTLII